MRLNPAIFRRLRTGRKNQKAKTGGEIRQTSGFCFFKINLCYYVNTWCKRKLFPLSLHHQRQKRRDFYKREKDDEKLYSNFYDNNFKFNDFRRSAESDCRAA
jgi:hypothetical protein